MRIVYTSIFVGLLLSTIGCGSGAGNSNVQQSELTTSTNFNGAFAISASVVASKSGGEPEYCFLQLRGISESQLKSQDLKAVQDVVPIYSKSISRQALEALKSPELRRSVELAHEGKTQTQWKALQADVKQALAKAPAQGFDCKATADSLKGVLGLSAPSEATLEFGRGFGWGFCFWACAVLSQPPGDFFPTRGSHAGMGMPGRELPSYPTRTYRPY
ncbi:MAG: hypothetical protein RI932_1892 [Pseudomonadota bacterium]